jgi:hypothetical protein
MDGMWANVSQSPNQAIYLSQTNGVVSRSRMYAARFFPW